MKTIILIIIILISLSLNLYAQNENTLSKTDKLYGLSKLWMEVSYNFAFFHQVPNLNWDSTYKAFIPKVLDTNSDWDYYLELQKFMTLLKDGHTRAFPPVALRHKYYGTATKSIVTRLIEGKIIITQVVTNTLKDKGLKQGMEIVSIENMDVFDYAETYVAPIVYASTPHDLDLQKYGHFLLSGSTSKPIQIEVKDFKGNIKTYTIDREPWILEHTLFTGKQWEFEILPDNIGYLKTYNFVDNEHYRPEFDSLYQEILTTDGLIIDVRNNVGGATQIAYYILKHFTDKPFKSENWRTPNNISAHRAWGSGIKWMEVEGKDVEPHQDRPIYTKPLNVLAGAGSFSGAEDFCVGFLTMKRGKLIGSKTAGSSGSPMMFSLHGNDDLMLICTKQDFFPDGKEFIGFGISPDIEVRTTIKDVIENRDPVLEMAINDILGK